MKHGAPVLVVRGPLAGTVGYYRCAIRDGVHCRIDTSKGQLAITVVWRNVLDLSALVDNRDSAT